MTNYAANICSSGRGNDGINFKHRARNAPPLNTVLLSQFGKGSCGNLGKFRYKLGQEFVKKFKYRVRVERWHRGAYINIVCASKDGIAVHT